MRQAAVAKSAAPNAPSPRAAGEIEGQRRVLIRFKARRQTELVGAAAEQFVHRLAEQVFAGAINQSQTPVRIEGKNGDIDFGHDRTKKSGCFKCPETL